ncbi:MAG: prephenate dehydratase [Candidatus Omnitrophica bacterium]|nr:prephenate dehydratase [Candidatus Omnitrophota bacterium]
MKMKTIAYLGPEKTNTHLAAQRKFGNKYKYVHAPTVEDVFYMVEREDADFGVVPIENSLEGSVTHTLDRFVDFKQSPARIFGEIEMPIQHYLITSGGSKRKLIQVIFSHPQALAQCRQWLDKNYLNVVRRETRSTAEAVDDLRNKNMFWPMKRRAAIASLDLAEKHGLKAELIPVGKENRTRFLIIALRNPGRGRKNKTSVLMILKDKPGALHDALMSFKRNKINLTKIESRPSKRKMWEYVFFIDFEGHELDPQVKRTLRTLQKSTMGLRVLGSYPTEDAHGRG